MSQIQTMRRKSSLGVDRLCGQRVEWRGGRLLFNPDEIHWTLTDHGPHFDTGQRNFGGLKGFEAQHGSRAAFDETVIRRAAALKPRDRSLKGAQQTAGLDARRRLQPTPLLSVHGIEVAIHRDCAAAPRVRPPVDGGAAGPFAAAGPPTRANEHTVRTRAAAGRSGGAMAEAHDSGREPRAAAGERRG